MKIEMEPGRYVVAVSGGVDSIVLLDLLVSMKEKADLWLAVAHLDHGIRQNSARDRKFVEKLAKNHGLEFFYEEAHLGTDASEALAREKRYEFLEKVKKRTGADAIITAHHEDDVLETIVINLMRGSGRKGLSSLSSRRDFRRPLLGFSKARIIGYAKKHKLAWHEDETNSDQRYLRNFVRHSVLSKLSSSQREAMIETYSRAGPRNEEIDRLIDSLFFKGGSMPRELFSSLDHKLACEVVASWLRKEKTAFDKRGVERIVVSLKTARENKIIEAGQGRYFSVGRRGIRLNSKGSV